MRILAIFPSNILGGMERAAMRLLEELGRRGAGLHVVNSAWWGTPVRREAVRIDASTSSLHFVPSPHPRYALPDLVKFILDLPRTEHELARIAGQLRPTHILATELASAYAARHLARSRRYVSVFRVPNPPPAGRTGRRAWFNRLVWRRIHRSFDAIVCNAEYTAARVADTVGSRERIHVIRNLAPARAAVGGQPFPPEPPERRRIAYVGQITPQKGIDELLAAARAIVARRDDVDVLIAGQGNWNDDYEWRQRTAVEQDGLADRIRFLGHVDDVAGMLAQCHVHVCPSTSDGDSFPNVTLNAKEAGLPSIVFPTAGLPEAVRDGIDGIVCADRTATSLEAATMALLDNPDRAAAMGAAARESLADHAPDRVMADWLRVLMPPGWKPRV